MTYDSTSYWHHILMYSSAIVLPLSLSGWLIQHPTTNFLGLFGSIQRVSLFRINSQKSRINISGPNVCWIKVEKNIPYHVWFIYLHNIINIKQMYVISNYIISLVVWERGTFPLQSLSTHFRSDLIFLRHTGAKFIRYLPRLPGDDDECQVLCISECILGVSKHKSGLKFEEPIIFRYQAL